MAVLFSFPSYVYSSETRPVNVIEETEVVVTKVLSDGTIVTEDTATEIETPLEDYLKIDKRENNNTPILPDKNLRKMMVGMELSTGLDLSGTDLSTFNLDFLIGYRYKIIQLLGVQFGAHKSLGSRDCFLPIQVVFRSSFTPRPAPVFFHLGAGYSFNTVSNSKLFGDITATVGCGINLVQRRKFQSNIIIGFGFRHFNQEHQELTGISKPNSGFAQISFGVSM